MITSKTEDPIFLIRSVSSSYLFVYFVFKFQEL